MDVEVAVRGDVVTVVNHGGETVAVAVPITFTEEGATTTPHLGVSVTASANLDDVASAIKTKRGPELERTDAEVAELVKRMKEDRPDLDWDNLLTGRLAGPATLERPEVPVWDYVPLQKTTPKCA